MNFISLYSHLGVIDFKEHETAEDALDMLKYGRDEGLILDIAVIDVKTGDMLYYNDFLGEKECRRRMDEFLISR